MTYRDIVQVYKQETPSLGGDASDDNPFPTGINASQDACEMAGLILNDWNGGTPVRDQSATVIRSGSDLIFKDLNNTSGRTLSSFGSTYDFLLDNEPISTGITYSNARTSSKITSETWINTATTKTIKLVTYTYIGNTVNSEVRKVYALDGVTIVAQSTLTYTFSGGVLLSTTYVRDV